MMKLAICDDDNMLIAQVEHIIEKYNQWNSEDNQFSPTSFIFSTVLRDEIADGEVFDAFILDIEMEVVDGFSLAREIRKYIPTAAIIFLSSHTEFNFTQEGYKVRALRYVSKLTMDTSLMEALETAAKACKKPEIKYFTISHYNDIIRIPYDEIIYIHRISRTTEVVTECYDNYFQEFRTHIDTLLDNLVPGVSRKITDQDKNVLILLAQGKNQQETAAMLDISQAAVSKHLKKIRIFLKKGL